MRSTSRFRFILGFLICASAPADPTTQPAAPWAKDPPDKWPQLVLTNEATFKDHTPLKGASSFLIRLPDGTVAIGTAKHLIKSAGGVEPPLPLADFDKALKEWRVFPRTQSDRAVTGRSLLIQATGGESGHDWLLLGLANPNATFPAEPLAPRTTPVEVGETVYLVGVPYSDRHSPQNVYKGVVTARPFRHYFSYQFDPPVAISGFSGAPILDGNGLLVGHGVARQDLKQKDGLEIEFGGEDVTLALRLWEHRNDAPIEIKTAIQLHLPQGWAERQVNSPVVARSADLQGHDVVFDLFAWPRTAVDDESLKEWAEGNKRANGKVPKFDDRIETDLKQCTFAGREAYEYEVTGKVQNVPAKYRVVFLDRSNCLCRLVFAGAAGDMDDAKDKCNELVEAIK